MPSDKTKHECGTAAGAQIRRIDTLPELPVIRETHCTQKMTDDLVRFIEQARPDLVRQLFDEEYQIRGPGYNHDVSKLAYFLEAEPVGATIPSTQLGILDFVNEFTRRVRVVRQMPQIKPRQLKKSVPDGIPPMPLGSVDSYCVDRGLTQELADKVLSIFANKYPQLWFSMLEGVRLHVWLYTIGDAVFRVFRDEISEIVPMTLPQSECAKTEVWHRAESLYLPLTEDDLRVV